MINSKGLVHGLYFAAATTTRNEVLQISIKKYGKKLFSSIPLRNEDFDLQYLKACTKIVEVFGGNLMEMVDTKHKFIEYYNLAFVEVKIKCIYRVEE